MTDAVAYAKPLIKEFEGLRLVAYLCPAGVWTIGYGHTAGVRRGDVITAAQAETFLLGDILVCQAILRRHVKVPLKSHQEAALLSFVFNLGPTNFASSTLLRELNKGDYARVASELPRWDKATVNGKKQTLAGLTRRRTAEVRLWSLAA